LKKYAPLIARQSKRTMYYKGIRQKADSNLHEQIVSYITTAYKGAKLNILDWGCGEGALSERLADAGHNVTSVDIDEKSFKSNKASFACIDFNNSLEVRNFIEQNKQKFDLIISVEVIEHIKSPWEFISDLRALNADILITTPNIASWWGRVWFFLTGEIWGFGKESWYEIGHINPITKVELESILYENNFEIVSIFMGGCLPIIWAYNWKRFFLSIFILPFRLIMKGPRDGWVLCVHAKNKY